MARLVPTVHAFHETDPGRQSVDRLARRGSGRRQSPRTRPGHANAGGSAAIGGAESRQNDELVRLERQAHVQRAVIGLIERAAAEVAIETAHDIAALVQARIDDDAILTPLAGYVVCDQHLLAVQQAREGERVGVAVRKSEMPAVAGDLPEIHAAES